MKFYRRKKERNNGTRQLKREIRMQQQFQKEDEGASAQNKGFIKLLALFDRCKGVK